MLTFHISCLLNEANVLSPRLSAFNFEYMTSHGFNSTPTEGRPSLAAAKTYIWIQWKINVINLWKSLKLHSNDSASLTNENQLKKLSEIFITQAYNLNLFLKNCTVEGQKSAQFEVRGCTDFRICFES